MAAGGVVRDTGGTQQWLNERGKQQLNPDRSSRKKHRPSLGSSLTE
jgi:hypothetical protein